jgi:hypothetical protein
MSKVLDAKYINTQLDQVDEQGWDGTAARELLERIRRQVIRPVINGYGLTDATASQAEATAWEETWRALCRPSIRTTDNPGLLLLVVARRSVHAELNSQRYATSPDKAARRYQETRAEGEEPRNMISLEIALENGLQLSQASDPADEDGALLSRSQMRWLPLAGTELQPTPFWPHCRAPPHDPPERHTRALHGAGSPAPWTCPNGRSAASPHSSPEAKNGQVSWNSSSTTGPAHSRNRTWCPGSAPPDTAGAHQPSTGWRAPRCPPRVPAGHVRQRRAPSRHNEHIPISGPGTLLGDGITRLDEANTAAVAAAVNALVEGRYLIEQ